MVSATDLGASFGRKKTCPGRVISRAWGHACRIERSSPTGGWSQRAGGLAPIGTAALVDSGCAPPARPSQLAWDGPRS